MIKNEYEQLILKMTKQLDDKDVSLDEYKKKLITLNNTYEKKIYKN